MDDLIRRGALIDVLANRVPFAIVTADDVGFAQGLDAAYMAVKEAPSVDAVEVVHARWYVDEYPSGFVVHRCIACGCEPPRLPWQEKPYAYCPNCGARMDAQTDQRPETGEGEKNEVNAEGCT